MYIYADTAHEYFFRWIIFASVWVWVFRNIRHLHEHDVILTKLSPMAVLKCVKMITFGATINENTREMKIFVFNVHVVVPQAVVNAPAIHEYDNIYHMYDACL